MNRSLLTLYFFLFTFFLLQGQNLQGLSGLYTIPTAAMSQDGTVSIGSSYLSKEYVPFSGYNDNAVTPYLTFTFLPFAEFSVRITKLINSKITTQGIGDRTFSMRVRLLKEKQYMPGVVIGLHDLMAVYGGSDAVYNNSLYFVASKHFDISSLIDNIGIHIGYGSDIIEARTYNFVGLFGGVSVSILNSLEIMGEYDAERFNAGLRITLFNYIKLLGGFMEMKHFSGGASVSFVL